MKRAEIEANARAPYARRILQLEAEAATLAAALEVCARYIELEGNAHQEADDRSALNMARAALQAASRGWLCPECGTTRALATTWQPKQTAALAASAVDVSTISEFPRNPSGQRSVPTP